MFIILVFTPHGVQLYAGEPCDDLLLSVNFGHAVFFNDHAFTLKMCESLKKRYPDIVREAYPFSFNMLSLLLSGISFDVKGGEQ